MITLYSYPELFGLPDNNGYGLKVFAFLRLAGMSFEHAHIFDASAAPRGQLPYIDDDGQAVGDSDTIIAHLIAKYGLSLDDGLTGARRDLALLISRLLDDLYWVISYSRWKDERYWPAFRDALLQQHPELTGQGLRAAREHNAQRYHFQGIGRYDPPSAYGRGVADLEVLADLVPERGFLFGAEPTSADAAVYGFLANIWFLPFETPLRRFLAGQSRLVRHCTEIHARVGQAQRPSAESLD